MKIPPLCDNPSGEYCPACRAVGMSHCSDPINCGGMQKMTCRFDEIKATELKLRALQVIVDKELAQARKDAARYRFLRSEPDGFCVEKLEDVDAWYSAYGESLDAAIDAELPNDRPER